MKLTLSYSILLLFCVSQSYAGPWARKQGSGFVQLGFSTIGYNKVYADDSRKYDIPYDVRDNVVQVFAEYGVTDRLTASALLPFKFLSAKSTATPATGNLSESGISDIDIAVRYNWFNSNGYVISNGVVFGLPAGKRGNTSGLILGDGEFNVLLKILAGKSFHPIPFYVSADIGYNFRYKGFSDDVFYNVELGYGLMDRSLYLIFLLSGRESTSNKPTIGPGFTQSDVLASGFGLLSNNQEYTALIGKVFFKASANWGISASFATATHGRNIAGGFVFAGGVLYEY